MVMDRKMLLLDRSQWVYQFSGQLQRNVFDVEPLVECIVMQREFVHLVAEKEREIFNRRKGLTNPKKRKGNIYLLIYFFARLCLSKA